MSLVLLTVSVAFKILNFKKGEMLVFNRLAIRAAGYLADVNTDTDLDTFLTTIKGGLADLSSSNLAKILVASLGVTVILFLCWFGYRWVTKKVSSAIKKGKL